MKYISIVFFLFLICGCTPLVLKNPVGRNLSLEELKKFEGTWVIRQNGEKPQILKMRSLDSFGTFKVAVTEWDEKKSSFAMEQMDVIIKNGESYGLFHVLEQGSDNSGDNPLYYLSLFQMNKEGEIEYFPTDSEKIKTFLQSGILKTETVGSDIMIVDEPAEVIRILESNISQLRDTTIQITASKLND